MISSVNTVSSGATWATWQDPVTNQNRGSYTVLQNSGTGFVDNMKD